jgi:protein gp37
MENTKIEWCDHTFNPWIGCTKVSAACDNCYAEAWAKRHGRAELWNGQRRRTTQPNWHQPIKWNERPGRQSVFSASLADVFDNQVPPQWRCDLFELIAATPNLVWMLLTKRPQNIKKMLPADWPLDNVWLGTTTENQTEYDRRWPHLARIEAAIRFISYEPALGPLHLDRPTHPDWVIVGGESGTKYKRPMDMAWARNLRDECHDTGIAFFMKQIDKVAPIPDDLVVRQIPLAGRSDGSGSEEGAYRQQRADILSNMGNTP